MDQSPIEQLLAAIDERDVDAVTGLFSPNVRMLSADGRRAEGIEAARKLVGDFFAALRSTAHRITDQWHVDDVWIAELEADYELQDWMQLTAVPRALVLRKEDGRIADARFYGAHERPVSEHGDADEGMWISGRWIPPL